MATYRTSAAGGGTSGSGDRTASITPAVGDLLVVIAGTSGNTNAAPTCSDNNGGSSSDWTLIGTALKNASADILSVFVRNKLMTNTTSTTVTVATGSNTAGEIVIVALSGMSRVGANAVRSKGFQANQAAAGTPAPALDQAALTGNLTITGCFNATAGGSVVVPNASWTERQDVSQSTPTTGVEVATRDSGFTGTTITAAGTSSTAFASFALEFDATSPLPNEFSGDSRYTDYIPPKRDLEGALGFVAATLLVTTLSVPYVKQNVVSNVNPTLPKWYQQIQPPPNVLINNLTEFPKPFAQLEWPNPSIARIAQQRTVANALGTTLGGQQIQLRSPLYVPRFDRPIQQPPIPPNTLGNLLLAPIVAPFYQLDWPNPQLKKAALQPGPSRSLLSEEATLGRQSPAFRPIERKYFPPHDPVNLLGTTLAGVQAAPFYQVDWPNPSLRKWQTSVDVSETGRVITEVAAPFTPIEWTNPATQRRALAVELAPNLFLTTLQGQEILPFRQRDWPNPTERVRQQRVELQPNLFTTTLVGQETLPFRQRDWPNPTLALRQQRVELIPNLFTTTLVGQETLPFRQRDWANPNRPARGVTEQPLNLLVSTLAVPTRQLDWPNPRTEVRQQRIDPQPNLITTTLVGQEVLPFRQRDWPNPRLAVRQQRVELGSNLLTAALYEQEVLPFRQRDWQNPTLRTRQERVEHVPNLIVAILQGQEVLPFRQTDWANPKLRVPQFAHDTPPNLFVTTLQGQEVLPFRQSDWEVVLPLDAQQYPNPQNVLLSATAEERPFSQADWPLPRTAMYNGAAVDLPAPNLLVTTLATPFRELSWLVPSQRVVSTHIVDVARNLLTSTLYPTADPFTPKEYPNPLLARQPNVGLVQPVPYALLDSLLQNVDITIASHQVQTSRLTIRSDAENASAPMGPPQRVPQQIIRIIIETAQVQTGRVKAELGVAVRAKSGIKRARVVRGDPVGQFATASQAKQAQRSTMQVGMVLECSMVSAQNALPLTAQHASSSSPGQTSTMYAAVRLATRGKTGQAAPEVKASTEMREPTLDPRQDDVIPTYDGDEWLDET